ncbi:MAG: MFS transporter [Candidatus Aenigmatarchaeota archaeon]|nr:MFS transporter [Candidatus Aenigmarchaeota archaeon]
MSNLKNIEKNSIISGSASSFNYSIISNYSTPFALFLGASNFEIGILTSISNLLSTTLQPLVISLNKKFSIKFICISLFLLSILLTFFISFFSFIGIISVSILIILITSYNGIYSLSATAWASWISGIVSMKKSGKFFGKRNFFTGLFSFIATIFAGWLLGLFNGINGFSLLFFIASIFGIFSYFYLNKIPNISMKEKYKKIIITKFSKPFKKFLIYMFLINFAVFIASPFFAVYALKFMKVSYEFYALILSAEIISAFISQLYWGKIIDRFGIKSVMSVCGVLIAFVPFFWVLSPSPYYLILANIFSGFVWSGFDLSWFNYLVYASPINERTRYISQFKIFSGIAVFLGSFLGGIVAQNIEYLTFLWFTGLQLLLLLSFFLRLFFSSLLFKIEDLKKGKKIKLYHAFINFIIIYPMKGLLKFGHIFEAIRKI